nr:MAG TPA: hypothetical protein [Caudoviricetes sp.]DAZ29093.1 MAG TPA: hypothetical protein [Caudoviricetes sp.]
MSEKSVVCRFLGKLAEILLIYNQTSGNNRTNRRSKK